MFFCFICFDSLLFLPLLCRSRGNGGRQRNIGLHLRKQGKSDRKIILIARIVNPEKMKEYEDKFIWDDDGLLAYNNANIAVLGEIIANIDTNGFCSRRLE